MPMTRSPLRSRAIALAILALGALAGGGAACRTQAPVRPLPFKAIEILYRETRALKDEVNLTRSRGAATTTRGVPLADLVVRYDTARRGLQRALDAGDFSGLDEEDRRALGIIKRTLQESLTEEEAPATRAEGGRETGAAPAAGAAETPAAGAAPAAGATATPGAPCDYDPEAVASGPEGYETLGKRIYDCFGQAAHALTFEGRTMDRLTVFSLLPLTDDPAKRQRLFMALEPVWKAVNGDGTPRSPYRRLIRMNAARLKESGKSLGESVREIGVDPELMERYLTSVLQAWHDITPGEPKEPWDFAYMSGRASRALREAIPLEALRPINDRYYRDLGADVERLQVRYDLEPRAGKDPVAFTDFGLRPEVEGQRLVLGEPWVFAAYQIGGLDNLLELLHETGHAIHIAAIRTRPAFADWPDSDIFTEGIADLASLEIYEPAWQKRYLGAAVPLADGILAKYSGIVMDTAWALFEVRLHREPESDPNRLWTEITSRYFRIKPHPELSWWAVRGQLIDAPGYMMNYAAGAIVVADLRARIKEQRGPYTEGDPGWYTYVSDALYSWGLERTSRQVIKDFLGRPISPQPLLDDMARARPLRAAQGPARGAVRGAAR